MDKDSGVMEDNDDGSGGGIDGSLVDSVDELEINVEPMAFVRTGSKAAIRGKVRSDGWVFFLITKVLGGWNAEFFDNENVDFSVPLPELVPDCFELFDKLSAAILAPINAGSNVCSNGDGWI